MSTTKKKSPRSILDLSRKMVTTLDVSDLYPIDIISPHSGDEIDLSRRYQIAEFYGSFFSVTPVAKIMEV